MDQTFPAFFPVQSPIDYCTMLKMRRKFCQFLKNSDFLSNLSKSSNFVKFSIFLRNGPNFLRIFPSTIVVAFLITYYSWINRIKEHFKPCKAPWGTLWVIYTPKKQLRSFSGVSRICSPNLVSICPAVFEKVQDRETERYQVYAINIIDDEITCFHKHHSGT